MKTLRVLAIILLTALSYQAANAQAKHHKRHHTIKQHHHMLKRH
ncbi:MAG TPA: hypothetical protein VK671_13610 [Mucilaginibacter sp.]|nr:hypothetical protein [Mucilaginibacter sp.]